jgi:hypothetical protein
MIGNPIMRENNIGFYSEEEKVERNENERNQE